MKYWWVNMPCPVCDATDLFTCDEAGGIFECRGCGITVLEEDVSFCDGCRSWEVAS